MVSGVFNQLKKMVQAKHNWAVIHLLSLSYVAVLFPGCFLIGREFRNVPVTFGTIVGATLLYGGAFYLVGNRGYGESTTVHAVALAEHVEGDRYDIMEWTSVFAIAGGEYAFVHPGRSRLYSDATTNEPVGGTTTDSQGLVKIRWTLGATVGLQQVIAAVPPPAGGVAFTATATAPEAD